MPDPFYRDELVTLYHGNCREITDWVACDVLVTDPPYGIGWKQGVYQNGPPHPGIRGDGDTSLRDHALELFGPRHAIVFGSPQAPKPAETRYTLIWQKPPDAGLMGSIAGWRRDYEEIYLVGPWKAAPAARSSVIRSNARGLAVYVSRGHPHAKPVDVLERLIMACPPGSVADPFAGSGSTLVAARNQGRCAIGVEIEEKYCEIAALRLSQGVLTVPVEAAPEPEYEQGALEGGVT